MQSKCVQFLVFNIFLLINIHSSSQCPDQSTNQKMLNKLGEPLEQIQPITLDTIKTKLKESGIFDINDHNLSKNEKKELNKLFEAVEIMFSSRARQPYSVQTAFSSLRMVERAIKKQLKEGQLSETLAARFKWDKLNEWVKTVTKTPNSQEQTDSQSKTKLVRVSLSPRRIRRTFFFFDN